MSDIIHGQRWYEICDVIWDTAVDPNGRGYNIMVGVEKINTHSCIIFCKMDFIQQLFDMLDDSHYNYVIISNNSDFPVDANVIDTMPYNIKAWYAQNLTVSGDTLVHIPIGLERPLGGGVSSDYAQVEKNMGKPKTKLIYMNHNDGTNPNVRKPISDKFSNEDWVTNERGVTFAEYMNHMSDHKFVFSPEGNGIDCHRTWEALYVGTIPIVSNSLLAKEFATHLPIIVVDDWNIVTEEYLNTQYDIIMNTETNLEMLEFDYWAKRIKEEKFEEIV